MSELAGNGKYVNVYVPPDAQPGSMVSYQY